MAYTLKHGDRPLEGITIQRAVGRGGFGEVYYALTDSGKQVAVKYLRDNAEVELRGVAHVMNLKSPHLITIYDVRHNEQDEPFVIMEYVSGPSLRELLITEPSGLGPQKTAFFLKGIAEGLRYLHERGIVHRDLKPGNIFYDDGYVKIGDYGLSKHISVSAHSGNTISVGTVHYMAPEIGSGNYTKSIDVYALGVMLYEMLTGRLPFTGSSMGEILMRHLSDRPDVSGIPEPFAGVIARALAKDPNDRYADVDEMVEEVTAVTAVSESLASFDASVLVDAPRSDARVDPDQTVTTPPKAPPVPVLDAREDEYDLPPIPPIPPVLDKKSAKRAQKLQKKARKLQSKAEKKARAVNARLEELGLRPTAPGRPERQRVAGRARWRQFVISLIVLFAASGGLGVAYNTPELFGVSLLYLVGGMLGTLLAYGLSVRRNSLEYDFQDRLLYTACGFVFMLPAFAAAHAVYHPRFAVLQELPRVIIPLMATLLVFNWADRVQMGRRQVVQGGTVFWHGLVGLIFAAMADAEHCAVVATVLSATIVILVQSVAGIFPLTAGGAVPSNATPWTATSRRAWDRVEGVYARVASAVERVGDRFEKAAERATGKSIRIDESSEAGPTRDAEQGEKTEVASSAESEPVRAAPVQIGYQPSFVGRTANAGLSFLAKLLLLTGLTVAVLSCGELVNVETHSSKVLIGAGKIEIEDHGRTLLNQDIPGAAVFVPLLLGTILLVVARRNEGVAHFLRGFFGCVFAAIAAVLAVGPAGGEMQMLFEGDWEALAEMERFNALIVVGVFLVGSFLLLFWPRRQGPRPIVI